MQTGVQHDVDQLQATVVDVLDVATTQVEHQLPRYSLWALPIRERAGCTSLRVCSHARVSPTPIYAPGIERSALLPLPDIAATKTLDAFDFNQLPNLN